ncbi:MAG: hypothetical protein D3910_06450 [Candidatus Electrothrix sp. ATG2]|nr:hypothetical protein [Candidatus Electrothrix sp. ATG2]
MKKNHKIQANNKTILFWNLRLFALLSILFLGLPVATVSGQSRNVNKEYTYWKRVGEQAAVQARHMLHNQVAKHNTNNWLALTNAGYAEVNKRATMGALDGLTNILQVSRGNHSLVEVQSAPTAPLWFAVYDKKTGGVAYLEVDPSAIGEKDSGKDNVVFSTAMQERINVEHLYKRALEFDEGCGEAGGKVLELQKIVEKNSAFLGAA